MAGIEFPTAKLTVAERNDTEVKLELRFDADRYDQLFATDEETQLEFKIRIQNVRSSKRLSLKAQRKIAKLNLFTIPLSNIQGESGDKFDVEVKILVVDDTHDEEIMIVEIPKSIHLLREYKSKRYIVIVTNVIQQFSRGAKLLSSVKMHIFILIP